MKPDLNCLDIHRPVLLACSGGRDSMALLAALLDAGCEVTVAHVNHAMRKSADRDERFVRERCAELRIACRTVRAEDQLVSEADAREFRYRALTQIARREGIEQIALAHHRGDQAETVLMHLFRGCGIAGASGMTESNGLFRRPLLGVSRAQIDAFVQARGIPFVEDETNGEEIYTRNYLRNRVLPAVAEKYPEYERAVADFAADLGQLCVWMDAQIAVPELRNGELFLPDAAANLPPVLCKHTVYSAARRMLPSGLTRAQIERTAALFGKKTGAELIIKGELRAVRDYGGVTLYRARPFAFEPILWRQPSGPTQIGTFTLAPAQERAVPAPPDLIFDADAIPNGAIWRTRKAGDVFTPFGGGTRPLKEYLIDRKVPARTRDKLILLCYNETVLVVGGIEIARGVRMKKESRNLATIGSTHERSQGSIDL